MIHVRVRFFAVLRDLVASDGITIELPEGARAMDALDRLIEVHPSLGAWRTRVAMAVNQEYAAPDQALHDSDELALIPPVSGG